MLRRIYVSELRVGELELDQSEAHHARTVLRLGPGEAVELFDEAGNLGRGEISAVSARSVRVRVETVDAPPPTALRWTIASAVPKGERADWMIEKLCELGATAFVPLATQRSVVLPGGEAKRNRWRRLTVEAAKQSRRRGVMRVESLTAVDELINRVPGSGFRSPGGPAGIRNPDPGTRGWYLSTSPGAHPIVELAQQFASLRELTMLIGPEGGWTAEEIERFDRAGLTGAALTGTILRVETAAVAAAVIVAAFLRAPMR